MTQETESPKLASWELDLMALPNFHDGQISAGGLLDESALSSWSLLSFCWRFFVLPSLIWINGRNRKKSGMERAGNNLVGQPNIDIVALLGDKREKGRNAMKAECLQLTEEAKKGCFRSMRWSYKKHLQCVEPRTARCGTWNRDLETDTLYSDTGTEGLH